MVICFFLRRALRTCPTDKVHQLSPIFLPKLQVQLSCLASLRQVLVRIINYSISAGSHTGPQPLGLPTPQIKLAHITWCSSKTTLIRKERCAVRGGFLSVGCKFNKDSHFLIKRGPQG